MRVILVDNMQEQPIKDLMMYQQCIDQCALEGVQTLWITKEKTGDKVKFGLRRAGREMNCQTVADALKLKHGETKVMGGGHPYAAAVLCDPEIEAWTLNEIVEFVGANWLPQDHHVRGEVEHVGMFKKMVRWAAKAFCPTRRG